MAQTSRETRDLECFKHFMNAYKHQWDLNKYARDNYDEDLEYYLGYRNKYNYPMAYNEVFNKLLPRIFTLMSRFMDQLYQGGPDDLTSVRARKRQDVERAPRVKGLLNYQLENLNNIDMQGGSYLFNFDWMFNAVAFGKGISKLYWKKEERIAPRRRSYPVPRFDAQGRLAGIELQDAIVQEPQILYDAPYAEVIHPKLFVPHPHYRSIQKMPFVFCVYKRSTDYLNEMRKKGVYRNVDEIGWSGGQRRQTSGANYGEDSTEGFAKSIAIEGALYEGDFNTEKMAPEVDVIEGYGKYIFPEDETPYEVGSGIKIKGKESGAIVHIGNYKALLKVQKNTYEFKPFIDISGYMHPELYWDLGIIRLGKGIQEQYNNLANLRMDNALRLVNQMLMVRKDAEIEPEALVWKPFGLVPVEELNSDVAPLVTPDISGQVFREQEEFFENTIEEMTGMYKYAMGSTPSRQENVGTIYSIQQMAESRSRLLLMTMDYQGFRPFLRYMMILNAWHYDRNREIRINTQMGDDFVQLFADDIHPDFDFSARYTAMEPALGKQYRAQQLIQYAQMWQQSPYLQHHQFMRAILELLDFHDTDKYLKSPEQLQQEQMQAAQAEMLQMSQQFQAQDQMSAKQEERKLLGDVTRELVKG